MYYIKGSYLYEGKAPAGSSKQLTATRLPEAFQQFNDHLHGKPTPLKIDRFKPKEYTVPCPLQTILRREVD
jgi:hypothetical protein